MNLRTIRLALALSALASLPLAAQLPSTPPGAGGFDPHRLEVLHRTMRALVDEGKQAGIVWLIARDGKIVDFEATGHRDLEHKLPMQKDTICRVYSMSKLVTSVATLVLLEEGKVLLDDPVGDHLPELKTMRVMTGGTAETPQLVDTRRPVTIKHLLTHTSGLIYDFDGTDALHQLYQRADLWSGTSLKDFTAKVARLPLRHQPGEDWSYGINCDVLGALVERVSGQPFEAFLRDRIFGPLGMKDTSFDVPAGKRARLARTYRHDPAGKLVEAEPMLGTWPEAGRGLASGGAGLFSTAGDYARFAQMLLNGGELEGRRILGRKTVEFMTANHLTALPRPRHAYNPAMGFGLGVEVRMEQGQATCLGSVGQFGWYGAATTYCQIDPQERIVAIALAQHFPFNQHKLFERFANGCFQALTDQGAATAVEPAGGRTAASTPKPTGRAARP